MIPVVSNLTGLVYQTGLKPLLFALPADRVHETFVALGHQLGQLPAIPDLMDTIYTYRHPALSQTWNGLAFANPVGLAAGFDYQVQLPTILPKIGFGWTTVGTITQDAYAGNSPPMLDRLPQSRALWVNKGFKNPGITAAATRLAQLPRRTIPVGLSIGATNRAYNQVAEQITEYLRAFTAVSHRHLVDYYELNISCPNVQAKKTFQSASNLRLLLNEVAQLHLTEPVLVKMPIDLPLPVFLSLVDEITRFPIAGIIIGNLTKDFHNPALWQSEAQRYQRGGFSGKAAQARSNDRIRATRRAFGSALTIVGTGGIFTAADAYAKIKRGATFVQLITGMVYQGPQVIGQINRDLVHLLHADGISHISAAIGVE